MNLNQSKLYLGSQSKARKQLLEWAQLTAKTLHHTYDEDSHPHRNSLEKLVTELATEKKNHLILPQAEYLLEKIFIITADTLIGLPSSTTVFGKPKNLDDAKKMLTQIGKQPVNILTGCCITAQQWNGIQWNVINQKTIVVGALVEFCVETDQMDTYFKNEPNALNGCGASVVDSYGQCFFKSMHGSYSAILGLPLFELRIILKQFGFQF